MACQPVLASDDAPYWKASASLLLDRWTGSDAVREALIGQLKHEHPLVRGSAVQSLAPLIEMNVSGVRSALEPMLTIRCAMCEWRQPGPCAVMLTSPPPLARNWSACCVECRPAQRPDAAGPVPLRAQQRAQGHRAHAARCRVGRWLTAFPSRSGHDAGRAQAM